MSVLKVRLIGTTTEVDRYLRRLRVAGINPVVAGPYPCHRDRDRVRVYLEWNTSDFNQ